MYSINWAFWNSYPQSVFSSVILKKEGDKNARQNHLFKTVCCFVSIPSWIDDIKSYTAFLGTYMAFWLAGLVEDSGMDYFLHLFCACTSGDHHVLCLSALLIMKKEKKERFNTTEIFCAIIWNISINKSKFQLTPY